MQKCYLSILSKVDGKPTKTEFTAFLDTESTPNVLSYRDKSSEISMTLGETLVVERKGDYGLLLPLKKGERTEGKLYFGKREERVPVQTTNLWISIHSKGLKILADYDLDFGSFLQNMRLYVVAKFY